MIPGLRDYCAQLPTDTLLLSRVTAALTAKARPTTVVPPVRVMLAEARMLPWNAVPVPSVPELPTCQYTLHGDPPPAMTTEALEAVVIVLPIWKIQLALASPP